MSVPKILNVFQIIKNYQEIVELYQLDKYLKKNNNKLINESNENINNNNNIENEKAIDIRKNTLKKMIIYKSKIISKIELSVELLYNIFFKEKGKKANITLFFNLIFELFKAGVKIKELYSLKNIGIPFYVEEDIFYKDFLGIDKSKYINNIIKSKDINNVIIPMHGNLFLPIKDKNNNIKYKNKFINEILIQDDNNKNICDSKYINKIHFVGEILYILRPIIYLTLLSIFQNNKIIPLIVNIVLDIVIYFSRIDINRNNFRNFGFNFLIQKIHYLEMNFRNKHFFIYLFREPIFSFIVIPLIRKILNILYLPNFIVKVVLDIMENFSNYSYIA